MEDLCYIGYLYGAIIGGSSIAGAIWIQYILWYNMKKDNRGLITKLLSIPYSIIVGGWIGAIVGAHSPIFMLIYILHRLSI